MLSTLIYLLVITQCYGHVISANESLDNSLMKFQVQPVNRGDPPDYFDWREKKMVSPVKNQLNCNACWAFAAVACIESHLKIYTGAEEKLSEQFLIDCDEYKNGCGPGSILKTFGQIVSKFGGVLRNNHYYPYEGAINACRWHKPPPRPVPVIGFRRVPSDENAMVEYLWKYGPLAAAINAATMGKYEAPVIDEPSDEECNPKNLTHAVLIVGYSYHKAQNGKETPYWIIKNSWGSKWGDSGFYYLIRGRNACGIASDVSFAMVA